MKNKYKSIIAFLLLVLPLLVLTKWITGYFLPTSDFRFAWFYSGIFMVIFSMFFIEPYYTAPTNVITNATAVFLVLAASRSEMASPASYYFWVAAMFYAAFMVVISVAAVLVKDDDKSSDSLVNKLADILKNVAVTFGNGRVLYSGILLFSLLVFNNIQPLQTLILSLFWLMVILSNPQKLVQKIKTGQAMGGDEIGEIFGIQSKKIFLVKLKKDRLSLRKFDIVKLKYSMQGDKELAIVGIVFDYYILNNEKWAKVLQLGSVDNVDKDKLTKNMVYKVTEKSEVQRLEKKLDVDGFTGVVIEGSDIGRIKFEYSKKQDDLQEGDLLELSVGKRTLYYQVVNGFTQKEVLESRNETGFIEGTAIQLGEWDNGNISFNKFGWVPSINTPIFRAKTDDIEVPEFLYPEYKLGIVPGTNLPAVINLDDAISHHIALLGVTGSGKSFIAREMIKELQTDTKVICVDFNGEFIQTINPSPENIIPAAVNQDIFKEIDWVSNELDKFANQQNKAEIEIRKAKITSYFKDSIKTFFEDGASNIKIFELPDVNNSSSILEYTKSFFKTLFLVAKEYQELGETKKICVVLEEAHTVIPEWNFSSSTDKTSQSLVNSIGQIALQGRKYGVGFMVIAQRTANVSKTVLTQCNTVICFQAFDETSFGFLGNYVGKGLVEALPNLKRYHAIVTGKGIKSNVPMIIDLERKE